MNFLDYKSKRKWTKDSDRISVRNGQEFIFDRGERKTPSTVLGIVFEVGFCQIFCSYSNKSEKESCK